MHRSFSRWIRSLLSAALGWPPTLSGRMYCGLLATTFIAGAVLLAVAFSSPALPMETADILRERPVFIVADAKSDAEAARKRAQEAAWKKELKWRKEANEETKQNRKGCAFFWGLCPYLLPTCKFFPAAASFLPRRRENDGAPYHSPGWPDARAGAHARHPRRGGGE